MSSFLLFRPISCRIFLEFDTSVKPKFDNLLTPICPPDQTHWKSKHKNFLESHVQLSEL